MTIDIGPNLRLIFTLVCLVVLVVEWWSFRLRGRR
jgi:hypothetical protein